MADIRSTENEFRGVASNWLNEFLNTGGYPFEIVTQDTSVDRRFPDLTVWLDRKGQQVFCGWELKTPETAVDDSVLLENAANKARSYKADYFVTWNMRDAIIWRTPPASEKVTRRFLLKAYDTLMNIDSVEDWLIDRKRELLKSRAREILEDGAQLFRDGHLHQIDTDATFFTELLRDAVTNLAPSVMATLVNKVGKEVKFKEGLNQWALKQGIPNFGEEEFYESIARQIIYRILGKIIFYQTLRKFRSDLPKMDLAGLPPDGARRKLNELFERARQIDYQAVFDVEFTDQVETPPLALAGLEKLLLDLNRFNFSSMPQDVVGAVFEKLIPYEERHSLGQYFTKEDLVDFIITFCVRTVNDKVLDPTCGTGTFLIRAYDRLKYLGLKDHLKLLTRIWGVDIAHFPAELATINLFRQDLSDYRNFPHILAKDFFTIKPDDIFEFPPPKPTGDKEFMIKENIPQFDAGIGNFPFIRQELIEKKVKGYKKQLERVIAEDWLLQYPRAFELTEREFIELDKAKDNGVKLTTIYDKADLKLSGQADIYSYLFFHTGRFIKVGGRLGFITSNAWLDVGFGFELQKFFLNNFKVIAIVESKCEPWFEDPSVNTIFTILERCSNKKERDNHCVKFVKVKKSLRELVPYDMKIEAPLRWAHLERLVLGLENLGSEFLKLDRKKNEFLNTLQGIETYEDKNFRTRIKKQGELLKELEKEGKTVKWGKYLRLPDIYFEILSHYSAKLVSLSNFAKVNRGIKSGQNEFFYLTEEKIKHYQIEKEFSIPIVKSQDEISSLKTTTSTSKLRMFLCRQSEEELRKLKKSGALTYIKWGESQRFQKVPSVTAREKWYDIGENDIPDFVLPQMLGERFLIPLNDRKSLVDQRLLIIRLNDKKDKTALWGVLNSCVFRLFLESVGMVMIGDITGLDLRTDDIENLPIPSPELFSKAELKRMDALLRKISKRRVGTYGTEIVNKERNKLDSTILKGMGLHKKHLKEIYLGITELIEERLSKTKQQKKYKTLRVKRDLDKVKQEIVSEVLPETPKCFPEDFVDRKYLKDAKEISLPNIPLKLGHYFMGRQQIVSNGKEIYDAESVDDAKFIIYAQKPNQYITRLPRNKKAITKAVVEYERYLKEVRDRLFETAFNRTHDQKLAESIAGQVFEEFGLPII